MSDIIKFYQFKKIDGKTVKVPDGFQRVLQKHKKSFHLIHKDINGAIKLLGHIFDDSQKTCLKEKIQLQPKRIWIQNVLKEIVDDMLDEIE
jgi:hypothetical protein